MIEQDLSTARAQRTPRRWRRTSVALAALLTLPSFLALGASTALAVATLSGSKEASPTGLVRPGDTITYTIKYSCASSNIVPESCAGATLTDVLPTFTNVTGGTSQVEFVAATDNSQFVWAGTSASAPAAQANWTGSSELVAGTSGFVTLTVRVPVGVVPSAAPVDLNNAATFVVPGGSPFVTNQVTNQAQATAPSWTLAKSGPSTVLVGTDATYTLRACISPITSAIALSPTDTFTFTDALPTGTTFVNATNGGSLAGSNVVWNFTAATLPALDGAGCFSVSTTVRWVSAADGGDATNLDGAQKTDTATAVVPGVDPAPVPVTTTLRGPRPGIDEYKWVSTGGYFVRDGDAVAFAVYLANSGELPLDSATLTDGPLPTGFTLQQIDSGTWGSGVAGQVQVSTDGTTWSTVITSTGTANQTVTTNLGAIRYVRWVFTGPIPVGFSVRGTVSGVVSSAGLTLPITLSNCVAATSVYNGTAVNSTSNDCASVLLESAQPHPYVGKSASPQTIKPGESTTYTVTVINDGDATGALVNPQFTDCLATDKLQITNVALGAGWTLESPASLSYPLAINQNPTACPGGTFIQAQYTGSLAAGQAAPPVTYTALANNFASGDIIPPGTYTNTAKLTQADGAAFNHCSNCTAIAPVNVPVVGLLESGKLVKGELDTTFTNSGKTTPGGLMTWRLTLQNKGNVDVSNPVFIDVFPRIGDTGVLDSLPRGTQWEPYLVTPITAPAGWTVFYSQSENPCRPEVGGITTGCDDPQWTSTPTAALPTYRSIKLVFTGTLTKTAPAVSFTWDMRAPVFDPSYDQGGTSTTNPYEALNGCVSGLTGNCPKAANSFAYGATPINLPANVPNPGLLTSEPPRVQIQVTQEPVPNAIGDLVWADTNHDGLQSPGEPGIANVRVELYKNDPVNGWTFVGYTYTDANGNYLFDQLLDGDYKVRIYPPISNGYITYADQTGSATDAGAANTNNDSDFPETVTAGGFVESVSVNLSSVNGGERDSTWDLGIWIPAPAIDVVKVTKDSAWADAQAGDGVLIPAGHPVTWIFTVTNIGNTYLNTVTLVDDKQGAVTCPKTWLAPQESMVCTKTGVAETSTYAGQYNNVGTVTGTPVLDPVRPGQPIPADPVFTPITKDGVPTSVTDADPSSYYGFVPAMTMQKYIGAATAANDFDSAPGKLVTPGDAVTFTYVVDNTGNLAITDLTVVDDNGTPANTGDDVTATLVSCTGGSTLAVFLPGTSCTLQVTGKTAVAGLYTNIAVASGQPVGPSGQPVGPVLQPSDPANYYGQAPALTLKKYVNGLDAQDAPGPYVITGSTVTFDYVVSNTGNMAIANIALVDDIIGAITCPKTWLASNEQMTCTTTAVAVAGQYVNVGTVTGNAVVPGTDPSVANPSVTPGTLTSNDPAHYFGSAASLAMKKYVNGDDAQLAPGVMVPTGDPVTFTYVVTNTGNVALSNVAVIDDNGTPANSADDITATYVSGDIDGDTLLDLTETWTFRVAGQTAVAGQYTNIGTASGNDSTTDQPVQPANDPANYYGWTAGVTMKKFVNDNDAQAAPGVAIETGAPVTFTYTVTNTGNLPLFIDKAAGLVDDNATPSNTADDFTAGYASGDTNDNGLLEVGEVWSFSKGGFVAQSGQYTNIAVVTAQPVKPGTGLVDGAVPTGQTVGGVLTADDPANYYGSKPGIDITKFINGQDANSAPGVIVIAGSTVTWTYEVRNTGDIALSNVQVIDDNGTSAASGDDFTATYVSGDTDGDNQLDVTEVWLFSHTGVATTGQYTNIGAATGTNTQTGEPVGPDYDPANSFGADPKIIIDKTTTTPVIQVGGTGSWTITVTNIGNVDLTDVQVKDPISPTCDLSIGSLVIGQSVTYTCIQSGMTAAVTNVATVTGTGVGPNGQPLPAGIPSAVTSKDDATITVVESAPPTPDPGTKLPVTGTEALGLVLAAAVVLSAGGVLVITSRRRRTS